MTVATVTIKGVNLKNLLGGKVGILKGSSQADHEENNLDT